MAGVNSREQIHFKVHTSIKSLVEKRCRDGMACTACRGANYEIQWESFEQHLTIEETDTKTFMLKIKKDKRVKVACGVEEFEIAALDIVKRLTELTGQFSMDDEYISVTYDDQGIVPPDDADWRVDVGIFESNLEQHSCGPFGIGSNYVGPEGGTFFLDGDNEDNTQEDRTCLEFPKNSMRGTEKVKFRYSIRATENFKIEKGYKLASMTVYINYNPKLITEPPTLHLPHWGGDEMDIKIAQAKREKGQEIVLKINDDSSITTQTPMKITVKTNSEYILYAKVIKKGTDFCYCAVPYALPSNLQNSQEAMLLVYIIYSSYEWEKILQMYLNQKKSQPNRLESSKVSFEFKDDQRMLKAKLNEPMLTHGGIVKARLKEPMKSAYIEMSGTHELEPWQVDYKKYDLLKPDILKKAIEEQIYPPHFCCQSKYTESPGDRKKVCITVDLVLEGANTGMSFPCHTTAELVKDQPEEAETPQASGSVWSWFVGVIGSMFKADVQVDMTAEGVIIDKYKQQFLSHVDAHAIARELQIRQVISGKISHEILSNAPEDANEILYLHLRYQSSLETLHRLCDVMKNKRGYAQMNKLGDDLKKYLEL